MFRVAILGHSLTPRELEQVLGVEISIYRKPGARWSDLEAPEFREFWSRDFDLAILILGGNDLAHDEPLVVRERAKVFIERAKEKARIVRVYTVEQRFYDPGNRFGVDNLEFGRKRRSYNRYMSRWLVANGCGKVDMGKPWLAYEKQRDGVHFNHVGMVNFKRSIIRVIMGVKGAQPNQ